MFRRGVGFVPFPGRGWPAVETVSAGGRIRCPAFVAALEFPVAEFGRIIAFPRPWNALGSHPGVRFRIWWLVISFAIAATAQADAGASLRHARDAQALLGPNFWSRIIRIENDNRRSLYPRTLHVLVFELSGILWFYSDVDGTQSLSLYRNHVAEDEADPGPLLRAIDPGFKRWTIVAAVAGAAPKPGSLPKGCFVESVAAWRRLGASDPAAGRPMLLSFYAERGVTAGHTVLAYASGDHVEIIDPSGPVRHRSFPASAAKEPLALARAFAGEFISRARVLPLPAALQLKAADSGWVGNDTAPAAIHNDA